MAPEFRKILAPFMARSRQQRAFFFKLIKEICVRYCTLGQLEFLRRFCRLHSYKQMLTGRS